MILERSNRLKIQEIFNFRFLPDSVMTREGEFYPGDEGKIYDLEMDVGDRPLRILLFDTSYGRKELLSGRFIHGKKARCLYYNCTATVARALLRFFPDVLGYVERSREHQILRAGRVLALAPYIEGLKTQGDDFKRQPTNNSQLYHAKATAEIDWGPETNRIFSDICPASGSTMHSFVRKALEESNVRKFIFNTSTSTLNALYRVIPDIPEDVDVTVICWEALFSVYRQDVTLPDGEIIHGGTIINLNPDPDFPHFNPIAPEEVMRHIHRTFQRDRVKVLPDIPGEVGEKIQDDWVGPLTYDFLEFDWAGIDLFQPPWREKAKKAISMRGVAERLKSKAPEVFERVECCLGAGSCC